MIGEVASGGNNISVADFDQSNQDGQGSEHQRGGGLEMGFRAGGAQTAIRL